VGDRRLAFFIFCKSELLLQPFYEYLLRSELKDTGYVLDNNFNTNVRSITIPLKKRNHEGRHRHRRFGRYSGYRSIISFRSLQWV
jgi:hypothetical protein